LLGDVFCFAVLFSTTRRYTSRLHHVIRSRHKLATLSSSPKRVCPQHPSGKHYRLEFHSVYMLVNALDSACSMVKLEADYYVLSIRTPNSHIPYSQCFQVAFSCQQIAYATNSGYLCTNILTVARGCWHYCSPFHGL
jgi:hypothetical protein